MMKILKVKDFLKNKNPQAKILKVYPDKVIWSVERLNDQARFSKSMSCSLDIDGDRLLMDFLYFHDNLVDVDYKINRVTYTTDFSDENSKTTATFKVISTGTMQINDIKPSKNSWSYDHLR